MIEIYNKVLSVSKPTVYWCNMPAFQASPTKTQAVFGILWICITKWATAPLKGDWCIWQSGRMWYWSD